MGKSSSPCPGIIDRAVRIVDEHHPHLSGTTVRSTSARCTRAGPRGMPGEGVDASLPRLSGRAAGQGELMPSRKRWRFSPKMLLRAPARKYRRLGRRSGSSRRKTRGARVRSFRSPWIEADALFDERPATRQRKPDAGADYRPEGSYSISPAALRASYCSGDMTVFQQLVSRAWFIDSSRMMLGGSLPLRISRRSCR